MKESSLKNSVLLRMVLVAVLILFLLIPIVLVQFLITDRQSSHAEAVKEVKQKWAGSQVLAGPILSIPVRHQERNGKGTKIERTEILHILPEFLSVRAEIHPEIRSRGIHRVVLYTVRLDITAGFRTDPAAGYAKENHTILWDRAWLTVGITDPKGIRRFGGIRIDGKEVQPQPGVAEREPVSAGFTIDSVRVGPAGGFMLSMQVELNGSEDFKLVPAGKLTTFEMRGSWGDPSFTGDFLPQRRSVREGSFEASWNVLDFNRNLRQVWIGSRQNVNNSAFGVKLILPVDEYQKNSRAVKYAIMFIALTFLAFVMIDVLTKTPFHPVHYMLVSLALILFFVLLLSLSEYIAFNSAYVIAGASIILLIGGYTRGVTRRWGVTGVISALLLLLYVFLFVLLQLEDYALLIGSLGLLASLSLVMYMTRKIDWFNPGGTTGETPEQENGKPYR